MMNLNRCQTKVHQQAIRALLVFLLMASSWPVLLHGETGTAQPVPSSAHNALDEATIKALDADAWPVREAATFRLLRDQTLTPDAIAKVFGQKLSAEQRLRLMQVAEHHVIRVMAKRVVAVPTTASLGVALEWLVPEEVAELGRPGTRVEATLPGFPAFGVLQPGDLIYALNSKGIDPAVMGEAMVHEMRDMIQQYQAGDTVELTILRDGQPRQLKVTLGSLDAMRTLYEPDTLVLQPLAAKEWARFREGLVGESTTKPSPKQ